MAGTGTIRRVALSTGGGDAPGLNAVIRSCVLSALSRGWEIYGIRRGYGALLGEDTIVRLDSDSVRGITHLGGTILGTTNRGNPFAYPIETSGGTVDYSQRVIEMFHRLGLDGLIVIGGDGTLSIAYEFYKRGIALVGVPKTIDNDIVETSNCFGFDTAVDFATEAIDRLHTTAEAHHRIMCVEVMGRYAGWIALHAGIAGGADVILIPEIPYDLEKVADRIREREQWGARFHIVVVAEGAKPRGGGVSVVEEARPGFVERLGGAGSRVAEALESLTGKETRTTVLGHLQRGGSPSSFDRTLATRFGTKAVELLMNGQAGYMVASHPPLIGAVPLEKVVHRTKNVPLDSDIVRTARAVGIALGD